MLWLTVVSFDRPGRLRLCDSAVSFDIAWRCASKGYFGQDPHSFESSLCSMCQQGFGRSLQTVLTPVNAASDFAKVSAGAFAL